MRWFDQLKDFIEQNEKSDVLDIILIISFIALSSFSIYHFLIEPYFAQ